MSQLDLLRSLLQYDDWANDRVLQASATLTDEQLDRAFDMGRGSPRRTLLHIVSAEHVWVCRWQGRAETPWPDEEERATVATMHERLQQVRSARDSFLAQLSDGDLGRQVRYRDSFGSPYIAALGDMIIQLCHHSAHHRAQIVNMIRRVGGSPPELDYMYWKRKPAE